MIKPYTIILLSLIVLHSCRDRKDWKSKLDNPTGRTIIAKISELYFDSLLTYGQIQMIADSIESISDRDTTEAQAYADFINKLPSKREQSINKSKAFVDIMIKNINRMHHVSYEIDKCNQVMKDSNSNGAMRKIAMSDLMKIGVVLNESMVDTNNIDDYIKTLKIRLFQKSMEEVQFEISTESIEALNKAQNNIDKHEKR